MVVALAVGLGGAIGALSRYGLDSAIERRTESVFPWATFVINVSGCLAVGFVHPKLRWWLRASAKRCAPRAWRCRCTPRAKVAGAA